LTVLGAGGKMDIDTLPCIIVTISNIMRIENRREEAENYVENPMYRSFELIQRFLVQTHGVQSLFCVVHVD
jgi:hypothetical protein